MKEKDRQVSLGRIDMLNWAILIVFSALAQTLYGFFVAKSVFVGGMLANVSFWFLKRDLSRLFKAPAHAAKIRFFIRYYIRFSILVVILYLLIKYQAVAPFGLLVGLSTVVFGVGVLMTGETRKICLKEKEAS